jgi:NCAIR mutase (PurE)-related protein
MRHEELRTLLGSVKAGTTSIDDALGRLAGMPFEDLGFARVDHHRALRTGLPEVVFCPGKTAEQVKRIFTSLAERSRPVMATRASKSVYHEVKEAAPDAEYDEVARMIYLPDETAEHAGSVVIASAGTADVPVGQEAALTAHLMGAAVETFWDAGVAGIHRLVPKLELLRKATVIVVVAGMEGALPSVVAGLVERPVIGVPTSVGYGASFGGIASLLGMLSSCAAGVSVVNIDNGFGAGYIAALINRQVCTR